MNQKLKILQLLTVLTFLAQSATTSPLFHVEEYNSDQTPYLPNLCSESGATVGTIPLTNPGEYHNIMQQLLVSPAPGWDFFIGFWMKTPIFEYPNPSSFVLTTNNI
jgi:hypothetical protein